MMFIQAVKVAVEFASSEERTIEEATLTVRQHKMDKQITSEQIPWPPSATMLSMDERNTPDCCKWQTI